MLENFPATKHDDEVDALSGAHETIRGGGGPVQCQAVDVQRPMEFSYFDRRIMRGKGMLF